MMELRAFQVPLQLSAACALSRRAHPAPPKRRSAARACARRDVAIVLGQPHRRRAADVGCCETRYWVSNSELSEKNIKKFDKNGGWKRIYHGHFWVISNDKRLVTRRQQRVEAEQY
jgi:hypothetical protein